MPSIRSTLAGIASVIFAAFPALGAEAILKERGALCDKPSVLACLNAYYSDLEVNRTPLGLEDGFQNPMFGGIFATNERRKRAAAGEELPLDGLKEDGLPGLMETDAKTAYRLLSAYPTARNLFLSLDLLARDVSAREPVENALDYVFLTKVIESTLHAATVDEKPELYEATERYRNCLIVALAENKLEGLRGACGEDLSEKAGEILATGGSETR